MIVKHILTSAFAVTAACNASEPGDATRVVVTEHNELGIVELEIERNVGAHDRTFEVRGLDRDGARVAFVRHHVGSIDDINEYFPGDDRVGSEHIVGADSEMRWVSRETNDFQLPLHGVKDPTVKEFVVLPSVASVLRDANIRTDMPPPVAQHTDEVAYDHAYLVFNNVEGCPTDSISPSPILQECCYTEYAIEYESGGPYGGPYRDEARYMLSRPASGNNANKYVSRFRSLTTWSRQTCAGADGAACAGNNCTYGPNGFQRPYVYTTSLTVHTVTIPIIYDAAGGIYPVTYNRCEGYDTGSTASPGYYGSATGNFGNACSCACDYSGRTCLDTSVSGGTCAAAGGLTCASTGCTAATGGSSSYSSAQVWQW